MSNKLADQLRQYFEKLDTTSLVSISDNLTDFMRSITDPNETFYFGNGRKYNTRTDVIEIDDRHQHMVNAKGYDEYTKNAIYRYILYFQSLFPNILTNEQLVERITNNLKYSIEQKDLSNYDNPQETGIVTHALYSPANKKITLDQNLSEHKKESYIFHELTHAITILPINETEDMESEFATESITSYMQELFEQKYYNNTEQINVYLSNYARQLEAIFGMRLFKEYVLNYRDISNLFRDYPVNANRKTIFHNLVRIYDEIYNTINDENNNNIRTEFANTTYELNMALFLSNYMLKHPELTDSEKIQKIKKLVSIQKNPNFDIYKMMLDKYIHNKRLINQDYTTRFIYNANRDDYGRDELLKEKYIKFLAAKRFGFTQIYDYRNNPSFPNRDNILYSYGREYFDYLKNQHYYNHITKLYYDADINLHGSYIEEVYPPAVTESKSLAKEIGDGKDLNRNTLRNYKISASSFTSFMFKATKNGNSLYVESGPIPKVYKKESIADAIEKCQGSSTRGLLYTLSKRGVNEVYMSITGNDLADNRDVIYETFNKTVVCRYSNYMKNYTYNKFKLKTKNIKDVIISSRQK